MKTLKILICCTVVCTTGYGQVTSAANQQVFSTAPDPKQVLLPNGWSLTPAGRSLPVGDLPLNIAVSSTGRLMAVSNNGQGTQSIQLIDAVHEKVLDNLEIPKSFYGLKFSHDEKALYASAGNDNWILKYEITGNKLLPRDTIVLGRSMKDKISPVGIEIDDVNKLLYVVTKEDNSLYVIDLLTKKIKNKIKLGNEGYTCVLSPDNKKLYISVWGGKKVAVYNTYSQKITDSINVSYNPNELILNKNGSRLFVANAGDNSVSVIDTKTNKVTEVLNAALYPDSPVGSVSNGLALSANQKMLYVANADNNALAVFDVSETGDSHSMGFIPVGWYPTNVRLVNKKLFVTNGKGFTSFPDPEGPDPTSSKTKTGLHTGEEKVKNSNLQYIANLMKGTLSIIDEPNSQVLAKYSAQVYKNTPYTKEKELNPGGEAGNPIPMKVGESSPIKHVFYIIKENRTYDQVFGDIKEGNGDSSLCLFGEKYTPNQHKLAKEYVLLDNFYVDSEVSQDGHQWAMAGHANDYLEKTWPTSYSGRGDGGGAMGLKKIANEKNGFIFDLCFRNNVSYRTYAEAVGDRPAITNIKGHYCKSYDEFNLNIRDTVRYREWRNDFDSLVAKNALPALSVIGLYDDHTFGLAVGKPTPFASVADNDMAVGLLVEHLSQSPVWKESAIFILEDDAQNGPDHVDAHRSNALVISPYTKRKYLDHTMYSTTGMLRTMELILGLPPMTQYDAAATPMWRSFTSTPVLTPFKAVPANIDLNQVNMKATKSAIKSSTLNFTQADKIDDRLFNEILYKGIKGEDTTVPVPHRSAFIKATETDDK
jgi:YVTN family beta-propeller protein